MGNRFFLDEKNMIEKFLKTLPKKILEQKISKQQVK